MRKIIIILKEPVKGQKQFEFTSDSTDLSDQIALVRDKVKTFPLSNIERVYLLFGKSGKRLNMTEMFTE